jgi:hypothetical protein
MVDAIRNNNVTAHTTSTSRTSVCESSWMSFEVPKLVRRNTNEHYRSSSIYSGGADIATTVLMRSNSHKTSFMRQSIPCFVPNSKWVKNIFLPLFLLLENEHAWHTLNFSRCSGWWIPSLQRSIFFDNNIFPLVIRRCDYFCTIFVRILLKLYDHSDPCIDVALVCAMCTSGILVPVGEFTFGEHGQFTIHQRVLIVDVVLNTTQVNHFL